jgi:hypothetical protein
MQVKIASVMGHVAPVVSIPVGQMIIAGVLLFVFKTLLDTRARFAQVLGVVSWASLPGLLSIAAAISVMYLKSDPADFNLDNPVGFNIGFYLAEGTPTWLRSIASSIDLFTLWTIGLLATGMSIVTGKPWKTALSGILVPWALWIVLKALWAAMFR